MTAATTLEQFLTVSKDLVGEEFYSDTWRSTSFLINLLGKIERYCESLGEQEPNGNFYSSEVAFTSAVSLMNSTYSCPTDDERFEEVEKMYEATIVTWIKEFSDDAIMDLVYLGCLANFVAGMRVHAIDAWIEQTSPSEDKFTALKLAKRDEQAVNQAVHILGQLAAETLA